VGIRDARDDFDLDLSPSAAPITGPLLRTRRAHASMAGSPVSSRACLRNGINAVPPVPRRLLAFCDLFADAVARLIGFESVVTELGEVMRQGWVALGSEEDARLSPLEELSVERIGDLFVFAADARYSRDLTMI